MKKFSVGLIGLGVMGAHLARNLASKGYRTMVFNRSPEKTDAFLLQFGGKNLRGEKSIESFVAALEAPRRIIVMVNAGEAVDQVIAELLPSLEEGDLIMDGGNSHYHDTMRREQQLASKKIHFIGCGISGGAEGALNGPSIMPGGTSQAYLQMKDMLEAIAAKDFRGLPCVMHVGPDGAGHYVNMIHNGIEYALLQTIAEAYDLLKRLLMFSPDQIAKVFEDWNQGRLQSFLFGLCVKVLRKKDSVTKGYLIDVLSDAAAQKGTGTWTVIDALEKGIPIPSIAEAVFMRSISSKKQLRHELAKRFPKANMFHAEKSDVFLKKMEASVFASWMSIFDQGMRLISQASDQHHWSLDRSEISRIWQGGCIIRTQLLESISLAMKSGNEHFFFDQCGPSANSWRETVSTAVLKGVPIPALSSALFYYEAMSTERLPLNLVQGLRDAFGMHGFERLDRSGECHADWS